MSAEPGEIYINKSTKQVVKVVSVDARDQCILKDTKTGKETRISGLALHRSYARSTNALRPR